MTLTTKMASTLRTLTRNGREETFSTTLVEDLYSRPLRALVAAGLLTMDYTGTRRVYTLTPAGRAYLEGKRMARRKPTETNGTPKMLETTERPELAGGKNGQRQSRKRPRRVEAPAPAPRAPEAKKPRAAAAPTRQAAPAARPGVAVTPLDVLRLMRELRDYADAHEGVDELLAVIHRVEELGRRFGGLDCVRESLEAIREFRAERGPGR
jgi:hypothetical protein